MTRVRTKEPLESFAYRALQERRRSLMARRQANDDDSQALLEEREADWEDEAAQLSMARQLQRLGDAERAQLALVSAALERLDDGSWGTCLGCGARIAEARLRVAPESMRCAICTNH